MSNIFKYCCMKDPEGSELVKKDVKNMDLVDHSKVDQIPELKVNDGENPVKMEQLNRHLTSCPFPGATNGNVQKGKPNLRIKVPHPIKLRNHLLLDENYDSLHSNGNITGYDTKCNAKVCELSTMDLPSRDHPNQPRSKDEVLAEAQAFLLQYFSSIRRENSEAHLSRLQEVKKELDTTGTYHLKSSELVFGAKLAWRNATRCIGRIQWKKLQIFDCREVTTASGMFEALCNHIKYGTNKGNIRSAITIFPQRTDGKHDYRIWNPQLISYAGYTQPDGTVIGDPGKAEFTEVCLQLGWKPPRTRWDILPIVVSADGKDPEFFEIPKDIIMEVHMEHPTYDWFKDLGLRWYALPAVSGMKMDCGGLEFTATAFNGWYMSTEIGCRNFCDSTRLNIIESVAKNMKLDTNSYVSLWKDRALVEINIAVLHSFHRDNASIVDHHSASEQFMKHLENEYKSRGGCPADWIWIVPPMASSLTAVYHQEMAFYNLRPSYDYQEPAWKSYQWSKTGGAKTTRKFHFKQIARAVKFTSKLFNRALSKRIKATILYATETGKSEQYAKELGTIFGHAFNAQVHCMADYDMFSIEHETLLLIVTSTFGNGEPPANGVEFGEHLYEMLYNERRNHGDQTSDTTSSIFKVPTPKSLMRTNSVLSPTSEFKKQLSRLDSNKSSIVAAEHIGPLSNVCFAVFALGSSAYPKYCNFGKSVDNILGELGGERILDLVCGDEMFGQEQQFRMWASDIFHVACESFCLDENDTVKDAKNALETLPLSEETVRFGKAKTVLPLATALSTSYKKQIVRCTTEQTNHLGDYTADRATIFVELEPLEEIKYDPGDHVGVMPCNRKEIVDTILNRVKEVDVDKPMQLQVMKETLTITGALKTWETHERIPAASIRDIFTRFLDITTPPSTTVLKYLAKACFDPMEAEKIYELAMDSNKYDDWRHHYYPHLGEILEQYPSCKPQASLLAVLLPRLQPRFYSISSSPLAHNKKIHLTVAVVTYKSQGGAGPTHFGVCSNYLLNLKPGDEVMVFIRRAPSFHLPKDTSAPLILVGPGSGIAPFRGFWHHRRHQMSYLHPKAQYGPILLFFGCRNNEMDLYKEEKQQAISDRVLTKTKLALSREPNSEKKHVQALLEEEAGDVTRMLLEEDGHFYVCGDCKMAQEVQQTLKDILKTHASMSDEEVENFILVLMDENRYHEDIFGITLRTAEVQSASRENAKRTHSQSLT